MKILWTERARADFASHDAKIQDRIRTLIQDIDLGPFNGLGKPEPLKFNLKGWWSRRITGDHRLVYRVTGKGKHKQLEIAQCRYHY